MLITEEAVGVGVRWGRGLWELSVLSAQLFVNLKQLYKVVSFSVFETGFVIPSRVQSLGIFTDLRPTLVHRMV